jgi:serine/threonine protein kinase
MVTFETGRKLGKGTYGTVYEGRDEEGRKVAIKCIDIKKNYHNVIEASIMTSYRHPYLAHCDYVSIDDENLYIIQEMAKNDMYMLTRGNALPLRKIKKYMYCIGKAIEFLHSRKIVHCDIKSSNLLLFDNDVLKLADFSLSSLMRNRTQKKQISNDSHRPPECYNEQSWSYPVDIWCLGCTLYELTYGRNIFPTQNEYKDFSRREMVWFCILDWIAKNEKIVIDTVINGHKVSLNNIPIKKVNHPRYYYSDPYREVNKLILKMLVSDPNKRITIGEYLNDPFFDDVKIGEIKYDVLSNRKRDLTATEIKRLNDYKLSRTQRRLTLELLSYYHSDGPVGNDVYLMAIHLAHMLLNQKIPDYARKYRPTMMLENMDFCYHEAIFCV